MASIAQKYLTPFAFLSSPEYQALSRMTNDIISNMGKAAYAAFGGGGVPYEYLGQSMANAGNAYLAGRMSGNPAAPVVGQRYF
jgi:hypothetical protein